MEDFIVLSILELWVEKNRQVDKREVYADIFLGERCVDRLVLGSASASMQDQTRVNRALADSGGARHGDAAQDEQRGSMSAEDSNQVRI